MKKPRILLINPRTYPGDGIDTKNDKHPPFGLAYLAAYMQENGYDIDILDMPASNVADNRIGDYVKEGKFNIVGITGMTHQITNGFNLAKKLRESNPGLIIMFGGIHATYCYKELLIKEPGLIDFIIRGEGELTFLELVRALENDRSDFQQIKGLAFLYNKNIFVTQDREFIEDLNELPLPSRNLLPMKEYFSGETIFGNPMIEVMASRGCPYECIFCSSPDYWKRQIRFRSVESVINEVELLIKAYNIRYFIFLDDGLTLKKEFLYQFCQSLITKKIDIKWRCLARVDQVNKEMLVLMKQAGCVKICYGVESGNQQILDRAKKRITIEMIKRAFLLTHESGIATLALMIIGHPYETKETINDSINLIRQLKPFRYVFQCMTPYVGTKLFNDIAKDTGVILSTKWEDYRSTENPMFVPFGLDGNTILDYHDKFMEENVSLKYVLRRIFIGFTLVGRHIFNKKFFFYPLYNAIYNNSPVLVKKPLNVFLNYFILPLTRSVRKLRVIR
ncbi:MAG: cobalamin B12-binding domain-containing protein [Candidatus Omnitrophica bacterium]|nr:cobalamin B12-binding domain-containing protein [Candidatus Omnitrophota bacterium]